MKRKPNYNESSFPKRQKTAPSLKTNIKYKDKAKIKFEDTAQNIIKTAENEDANTIIAVEFAALKIAQTISDDFKLDITYPDSTLGKSDDGNLMLTIEKFPFNKTTDRLDKDPLRQHKDNNTAKNILITAHVINIMLLNADGHAKNFAWKKDDSENIIGCYAYDFDEANGKTFQASLSQENAFEKIMLDLLLHHKEGNIFHDTDMKLQLNEVSFLNDQNDTGNLIQNCIDNAFVGILNHEALEALDDEQNTVDLLKDYRENILNMLECIIENLKERSNKQYNLDNKVLFCKKTGRQPAFFANNDNNQVTSNGTKPPSVKKLRF